MINFTVGPVQSSKVVKRIGKNNVPYFRTPEFSKIMLENEQLMKKFTNAAHDSRAIFITGSGTASMEATIANTLTKNDKVVVINGGGFGKRFVELLTIYEIPFEEIKLNPGKTLTESHLENLKDEKFTAFVVNIHETSTGVLYDINLISKFCKKNNLFLIVDAISSFLADPIDLSAHNIDIMITGSQKALACPPGVSIIIASKKAIKKINSNNPKCMYLNLKSALDNGERGQTPFTPAVGTLIQINARLKEIDKKGGSLTEIEKTKNLANDFRQKIKDLPLEICSESLSNAVTPIHPKNVSAYNIFTILKDRYKIWICPNGGELKDSIFRVGHIGELSIKDNNKLIKALNDMHKKNLL